MDDYLLTKLAGKFETEDIGQRIGRTRWAVISRAHTLGISLAIKRSYRKLSEEDIKTLKLLRSQGLTCKEISEIMLISYEKTRLVVSENCQRVYKHWKVSEEKELIANELVPEDKRLNLKQMSRKMVRSEGSVKNHIRELKKQGRILQGK